MSTLLLCKKAGDVARSGCDGLVAWLSPIEKPMPGGRRLGQTKRKLKIIHHGMRAADQLHNAGCPVVVEQAPATCGYFEQLDRLVKTGADQALLRYPGSIPPKELFLRLLYSRLTVPDVPQLPA